jgi:hypothetical protein
VFSKAHRFSAFGIEVEKTHFCSFSQELGKQQETHLEKLFSQQI